MSKKKNAEPAQGAEAFEAYYGNLFGERWTALRQSFFEDPLYCAYPGMEDCSALKNSADPYFLDAGSAFAACCLPVDSAERILDMCAAPGGKTLMIASLMPEGAKMVSNEYSRDRYSRLQKVCADYLSPQVLENQKITCFDGATWCRFEPAAYDAILLDAPCSSERHVLNDPKYLEQWSPSRIKNLAVKQWSLLSSAYLSLKPGGWLLYSTCALSPKENDEVVLRLRKKYHDSSIAEIDFKTVKEKLLRLFGEDSVFAEDSLAPEKTEAGWHILPDVQKGAGPLFFSLIRKGQSDQDATE